MKKEMGVILENKRIAKDTYQMTVRTTLAEEARMGQFVEMGVEGCFLKRPFSIARILDEAYLIFQYKVVGEGTRKMSEMKKNSEVDLFGPLGSGFPEVDSDVLLIGGGIGCAPLWETAAYYKRSGYDVTAVLGFGSEDEVYLEKELNDLGVDVIAATMDGSYGTKGTVLDAVEENDIDTENKIVMACGPTPMLKAVEEKFDNGYLSLEARMGCGLGACMGCVVKQTEEGLPALRICKDGPVFEIGKVVF